MSRALGEVRGLRARPVAKTTPETKAARFARGVAMGALAGAAIVGLLRYRAGRNGPEPGAVPAGEGTKAARPDG